MAEASGHPAPARGRPRLTVRSDEPIHQLGKRRSPHHHCPKLAPGRAIVKERRDNSVRQGTRWRHSSWSALGARHVFIRPYRSEGSGATRLRRGDRPNRASRGGLGWHNRLPSTPGTR
jgi:hypothetical protein